MVETFAYLTGFFPTRRLWLCADSELVRLGINNQFDVVVVSSKSHKELVALKRDKLPQQHLHVLTNADQSVIDRFSPQKKIGLVNVTNGRIVRQTEGGVPSDSFFR